MKSDDMGDIAVDIWWDDPKSAKKGKRTLKEKLESEIASREAKNWWNTFFILSCAIAVFIDPFLCYINAIDSSNKCFTTNRDLTKIYLACRTFTDIIYLIDFLISKCQCCCSCFCRPRKNRRYQSCSRNLLSTLSRIYVLLPIAQTLVIIKMVETLNPRSSYLYLFFCLQYALRIWYTYGSLKRPSIIDKYPVERWLRPILGLVPFILAAHLLGAFWYLLATQSQIECWINTRDQIKPSNSTCADMTIISKDSLGHVACYMSQRNLTYSASYCNYNISRWDDLCPMKDPEPKTFDFGIYLYALQSDVVSAEEPLYRRVFQSFLWALRNMSSFGSNLNSSMDTLEIFFSTSISIIGMALFLVYLNARLQDSKETTKKYLLEKRKQVMKPDIDLWLSKNNLSKDMESTTKKKKMETVIMDNIHKLEGNNDLNMQNLLSILPKKDKQRIIECIFLASLKKAPVLQTLDNKVLRAICQNLVTVTYFEDSYIIQKGKPIGKLLFFTQGSAITFSNGGIGTSTTWLKKGDFYGEELLSWFSSPKDLDIPISTENVIAQEKVEALVIRAGDLRNIFLKFWWLFSKKVDASELKHWEHMAASSLGILLTTWRRYKAVKGSRDSPDSSKAFCCFPRRHASTKTSLWEKISVK